MAAVPGEAKLAANWVMGDLAGALNKAGQEITESPVDAAALAQLVARIADGTISGRGAKAVFEALWAGEGEVDALIDSLGLRQISDTGALDAICAEVMAANPQQLAQYRAGKDKLLGFFVGQVMKATGGSANPQEVNRLLRTKLQA